MSTKSYDEMVKGIGDKARHMKEALLWPVVDQDSGSFIADAKTRAANLEAATPHSIFEGIGKGGPMIQATWSNALRHYAKQRNGVPPDDVLASAYQALENALFATSGKGRQEVGGMILEAANLETTEGILMRNRMVALILPSMLTSVTGNIVSYIPGNFNQSEIFKVWRVATSTFGDVTQGQRLKWDYEGQYSSMDQRYEVGTGDATEKDFSFNATAKWSSARPFKKKSIKIYHDRNLVAVDDGAGNLYGAFALAGSTVTVTGTVDYAAGEVDATFSAAPATGIKIHIGIDIDIEKAPSLIPGVNHEMDSRVLYPHESAIAASTTLQALWGMRREYNLNLDSMAMLAMRNLLAADKDRKHLRDMYFFAKGQESWIKKVPDEVYFQEHYETVRMSLLAVDAKIMAQTGKSGLVGIVADSKSAVIFKSMRAPNFEAAPGYQRIPQPHYIGRLFGMWDLYEDPQRGTDYSCLCFGKGQNIGEAAYIAGDAVPAMAFKHAMQSDLQYNNTLWELAYRDLNPFDGREYLTELVLVDA